MNRKLATAFTLIFCAACSLCLLTDIIFPYFMHFMQGLIIIGCIGLIWTAALELHRYCKALNRKKKETLYNLLFRSGWKSSLVTMLTFYRIIISPVLLVLILNDHPSFKWLLLSAFITDALDGFLARWFKVTTKLGARMDSLADDFLFIVSLIAIIHLHTEVVIENLYMIAGMVFILLVKMIFLYFKHKKLISGMHTYLTKAAALFQAVFFLYCIFYSPNNTLFDVMAVITMVAISEEIIIIYSFRDLKQNVKGLFFIKSQM